MKHSVRRWSAAQLCVTALEQSEWNLLEGVQEALHVVCRLVLQHLYAAFHLRGNKQRSEKTEDPHLCVCACVCVCVSYVYLGGLVEGAVGMDVVVKNDDPHHDPHAEQERVLAAETTRIFSGKKEEEEEE